MAETFRRIGRMMKSNCFTLGKNGIIPIECYTKVFTTLVCFKKKSKYFYEF